MTILADISINEGINDLFSVISENILPFVFKVIGAVVIFVIGRYAIKLFNKWANSFFLMRKVDKTVMSFFKSFSNFLLYTLLVLTIVGTFGVSTTSFAAMIASVGVALGMALSGNLQNFAGGLMILAFRPFRAGNVINAQNAEGTVEEIQIFHTIIRTFDNRLIYVPNGILSNGIIKNLNSQKTLRITWEISVEYGEDFDNVRKVLLEELLLAEPRILGTPSPVVMLAKLADSSVNLMVRAWVNTADYWDVYYSINEKIYAKFNEKGINFPFPQLTVHQG